MGCSGVSFNRNVKCRIADFFDGNHKCLLNYQFRTYKNQAV